MHDSGRSSTTDSMMWMSISQHTKCKYNEFSPFSGSQYTKCSEPPSSVQVQQNGTDTMRDLVVVIWEMQKNFASSVPETWYYHRLHSSHSHLQWLGLCKSFPCLNNTLISLAKSCWPLPTTQGSMRIRLLFSAH